MLIIDGVLILVLLISCYTDLRRQIILNCVVFPSLLLAFGYYAFTAGLAGVMASLSGFFLGLSLFILPYLLGGMGAGDVKLLAVVGAFKGAEFVFFCFLATSLAGGLISLVLLVRRRQLLRTLGLLGQTLRLACISRLTVWNLPRLDDDTLDTPPSLPYGVAIACGSLITYVVT